MRRRLLSRFRRDRRGVIAVMSALFGTAAIGFLALAVDLGAVYLERRELQGIADRAAMIAVANTADRGGAVETMLADEGVSASFAVHEGRWVPDRSAAVAARFQPAAQATNAVRVSLQKNARLYFGGLFIVAPSIRVEAVATLENLAAFQIGSRLARIEGGLLNSLLGRLTGTNIALTTMDYEALAGANVDLLSFVEALATSADVTAGTYDDVLAADLDLPAVVDAITRSSGASSRVEAALKKLASATSRSQTEIAGSRLLDLGDLGGLALGQKAGVDADVSILDLLRASALAANGANQIALDLGLDLGPLAGLDLMLAIGEPPQGTSWITVGAVGARVYTAQTRLKLLVRLQPILGISARVPIIVHLASAEAELREITCGADPRSDARVGIAARSSVASLWLGEPTTPDGWRDFRAAPEVDSATLLRIPPLVTARVKVATSVTSATQSDLVFNATDIAESRPRRVKTNDPLSTALAGLLGKTRVDVDVLGIDLGGVGRIVETALNAALPPIAFALDPVIRAVADSLGLTIGEAEVRVTGIRCNRSALVL